MFTQDNLDKLIAEASSRIGMLGIKVIKSSGEVGYFVNTGDGLKQVNQVEFIKASHSGGSGKAKIYYDPAELDTVDPRDSWMVTEEALTRRRNGEEIYQRGNTAYVKRYWQQERGEFND